MFIHEKLVEHNNLSYQEPIRLQNSLLCPPGKKVLIIQLFSFHRTNKHEKTTKLEGKFT